MENIIKTNEAKVSGRIISEKEKYHVNGEEVFYKVFIETRRKSGNVDIIPAIISEKLFFDGIEKNKILIEGQIRTFNNTDKGTEMFLFAKDVSFAEEGHEEDVNEVNFIGFICKKEDIRVTKSGRKINSLVLAVNRQYNKTDYPVVITWGKDARFISNSEIGVKIAIKGRIQSREYVKRTSDGKSQTRSTYEISAFDTKKIID